MESNILIIQKIFSSLPLWLLLFTSTIQSQDLFYSDNVIIGNLRRREVIPLSQINNPYGNIRRRSYGGGNTGGDLKYRRSKDIRDPPPPDRTFELTESQIREANLAENRDDLEKLENELRWLTIDTEEGIDHQLIPMDYRTL